MSIKNIGNYIKTSVSRGNPEGLKSFNSLNIKTTTNNLKQNPPANVYADAKGRKSATLVHRHSNPSSSMSSNHHASQMANHHVNSKSRALQQTTAAEVNALPRIRVNS